MTRKRIAFTLCLLLIVTGTMAFAKPGSAPKLEFDFLMFPNSVIVDTDRAMTVCLVNKGQGTTLLNDGINDDHLILMIPVGLRDADLVDATASLDCVNEPVGWDCNVDTSFPAGASVSFQPVGAFDVTVGQTLCFDVTGIEVNSAEGVAFLNIEQLISSSRAVTPEDPLLAVFKSLNGTTSHEDLANVLPNQHHTRYSNAEAVAAVGPHYTDARAVAAVGPHYTDARAVAALGLSFTSFGSTAIPGDTTVAFGALCGLPSGAEKAIGSGWEISSPGPGISLDLIDVTVLTNRQRVGTPNIWDFKVRNNTPIGAIFAISVLCSK